MTNNLILPDTSLCAIVRDEMINPAQLPGKSGIRSFVETHAPYVEQAVIVDTGSVDGTRQELEQLVSEFPNLKVSDRPFDNYASARNDSLTKVETKYALVLDVDELVTQTSFRRIKRTLQFNEPKFLNVQIANVTTEGTLERGGGHTIRLFENKDVTFDNHCWEILFSKHEDLKGKYFPVGIFTPGTQYIEVTFTEEKEEHYDLLHFLPKIIKPTIVSDPIFLKRVNWYDAPESFSEPPSLREGFKYWKQPNPHRSEYS